MLQQALVLTVLYSCTCTYMFSAQMQRSNFIYLKGSHQCGSHLIVVQEMFTQAQHGQDHDILGPKITIIIAGDGDVTTV